MPPSEPADGFPKYGYVEGSSAQQARRQLAPEIQISLQDILAELCVDPEKHPERMAPFSRDGKIRVYSHPQPAVDVTIEVVEEEARIYVLQYTQRVDVKKTVFISYSHDDKEWLDRLRKSLKLLERKGLIDIWDDTEIQPGDKWHAEIDKALQSSKVAVLLVSQNFAASDFILDEELPFILESAEREQVRLMWVAVSSAPYDDLGIGQYQALNDPQRPLDSLDTGEQNSELTAIYDAIKREVTGTGS